MKTLPEKKIMKYIKGTINYLNTVSKYVSLIYFQRNLYFSWWKKDKKSTLPFHLLWNSIDSWYKQILVALSIVESKYIVVDICCVQIF